MNKVLLSLLIVAFTSVGVVGQTTSVPQAINYQGRLTDSGGNPLSGSPNLEFNIYDSATGGTIVYGPQVFPGVFLVNGYFNVILGSTDAGERSIMAAFQEGNRFLGIKVNNASEIFPRQQILSAPYSIMTQSVASGGVTEASIADGAVNTSKIRDNALTREKLANGAIATECIAPKAVVSANIADGNVTEEKRAPFTATGAIGLHVAYADFDSSLGTVWANIPGAKITITTSGRPVSISLSGYYDCSDYCYQPPGDMDWYCVTKVGYQRSRFIRTTGSNIYILGEGFAPQTFIDTPPEGIHEYQLQVTCPAGGHGKGRLAIVEF